MIYLCIMVYSFVAGIRAPDLYSLPVPAVGFLLAVFCYTHKESSLSFVKQELNSELKGVGKTPIISRNA